MHVPEHCRVCVHISAPDLPFLSSLCLTGPRLLPSSSLSRRIRLLPVATWSSLAEREGLKDSLISTQIKRHFGFHPTRRLAGLAGPEASVCFLKGSLKADLWWVLSTELHHCCHYMANVGIGVEYMETWEPWMEPHRIWTCSICRPN